MERTTRRMGSRSRALVVMGLVAALAGGACTASGGGATPAATSPGASTSPTVDDSTAAPTSSDPSTSPTPAASETTAPPRTIPQPVVSGIPVAPESERVDVAMPSFSNPTAITNPLFPVSLQESVLLLGRVDGMAFRTEVTLLPQTRFIRWEGQLVEVLVSQYVAYLDGRLHEVAYDLYAQADDGSVWYFGEDVFNFADGAIVDTHGTWTAGNEGAAAMIMPGSPQVGDVYRPENIPGFVFEEVTVRSVGEPLDGPFGPIEGGLVIEELHMDGAVEHKSFAPGYGEFYTAGGGDVEALALAVPTDALGSPTPGELTALHGDALAVFEATRTGAWDDAAALVQGMTEAWERYRSGEVPRMIEPRMSSTLSALATAVEARSAARAGQGAIDAARWSLDLQLRHRPAVEVDLARFELWLAQIAVDAEAGDEANVNGDFFSLDYIRDRILLALDPADAVVLNTHLEELGGLVGDGDLRAASDLAEGFRTALAGFDVTG